MLKTWSLSLSPQPGQVADSNTTNTTTKTQVKNRTGDLNRLLTVGFLLYDILQEAKPWRRVISVSRACGVGRRWTGGARVLLGQ